jgi:SAM-dependent methyltransferase
MSTLAEITSPNRLTGQRCMVNELEQADHDRLNHRYARSSRVRRAAHLLVKRPRLVPHVASTAAAGAIGALRADPTLGWLNGVAHVRTVRPNAILGAEWGGMPGFMAALTHAAEPSFDALEIGCGGGRVTIEARPLVRGIDAFDVSEAILDEARHTTQDTPQEITYKVVQGFGDNLKSDCYHLAYSHDVFVHFEFDEVMRYALNISRSLRPNGRFVVSVYTLDSESEVAAYRSEIEQSVMLGARRVRRMPAAAYERIWSAAGFSVDTTTRSVLTEYAEGKRFTHLTYSLTKA